MSLALYRRHRPRQLVDLVGQDHIRPTLEALLKKSAEATSPPAHAILLTGPRGVGKTSVARIIAHQINGLEAAGDDQQLDIIEIDGASHNKVEQIRELIDKARITPGRLKYKVYIIDEVHTLAASQISFQAFLKTLEEPPEHVVFILATTEIDKVPATIISRCQRFAFRLINPTDLAAALGRVAKQEKIKLDPKAADLIARHSRGSLRDGLSILDQLGSLDEPVTAELVRQSLGLPRSEQIDQLAEAIAGGDLAIAINQFRQLLVESGVSPLAIADELIDKIRRTVASQPQVEANLRLLDDLIAVRSASQPEAQLEVALIRRIVAASPPAKPIPAESPAPTTDRPRPAQAEAKPNKPEPVKSEAKTKAKPVDKVVETKPPADDKPRLTSDGWRKVIVGLANSLKVSLAKSRPQIDSDGRLTLAFSHQFEANKFSQTPDGAERQQKLLAAIEAAGFICPGIEVVQSPKADPAPAETKASVEATTAQINSLFGPEAT